MQKVELAAAWYAADLQGCKQESKMHLLSVHEHVLNYRVTSWPHLLMIAGPSLERGPASLGLAEKDFQILRDGVGGTQPGWFDSTKIIVNGLSSSFQIKWRRGEKISFESFKISDLDLKMAGKTANDYRGMLKIIGMPTPSAVLLGLPGGEIYFRRKINRIFPFLADSLINRKRTDFLSSCAEICGMGRGASPTGDDLIHGALAAFNYTVFDRQFNESIAEELRKIAAGTTLMGRHMLETGRKGLTSEALRLFIFSLARGDSEPSALARVLKTGSQTGYDLAAAVLYFTLRFTKSTLLL